MQNATGPYALDMAKRLRGASLLRVSLGLVDTDAATTIAARESAQGVYYSLLAGLENETAAPPKTYATFEPARFRLDDAHLVAPPQSGRLLNEGYVSAALSEPDCLYKSPPFVRFRFSKLHTVVGLSFVFDHSTGEFPRKIRLRGWRGATVVFDGQDAPTAADWSITQPIERFDALEITFLESCVPLRRARLQQIMFGIGVQFEADKITQASRTDEIDPLTRSLPQEDFVFSVSNIEGAYNPDAPKNIWQYLEKRSPISVTFGHISREGLSWADLYTMGWDDIEESSWNQVYFGGSKSWLEGGRYYLTGQPSANATSATFSCKSILSLADIDYPYGLYRPQGISLHSLALEVLEYANLPLIYDGEQPYKLWEGLKTIQTTAPLPVTACRECLQLIAHAACCILYTDRAGYIRIEPAPTAQHPLHLGFKILCQVPAVTKLPPLREVKTAYYKYASKSPERKELLKMGFGVSGETTLQIEYSAATNITVECTGGTATWKAYTYGMALTLRGKGEVQVLVTGEELDSAATYYRYKLDPAEETGEEETIKNPLITNYAGAKAVTVWAANYLRNRSTYRVDYRGNPEIDACDKLYLQTQFEERARALMLRNNIQYDGTLSGSMDVKKLEER